jgi:hypothetical protein
MIMSHKNLILRAKEELSLYTPKKVVIQATSQLMARRLTKLSGFTVESEYHFLGDQVAVVERDRISHTLYQDEPKVGEPLPPDPPKKI